jgi:hypothetical protein
MFLFYILQKMTKQKFHILDNLLGLSYKENKDYRETALVSSCIRSS